MDITPKTKRHRGYFYMVSTPDTYMLASHKLKSVFRNMWRFSRETDFPQYNTKFCKDEFQKKTGFRIQNNILVKVSVKDVKYQILNLCQIQGTQVDNEKFIDKSTDMIRSKRRILYVHRCMYNPLSHREVDYVVTNKRANQFLDRRGNCMVSWNAPDIDTDYIRPAIWENIFGLTIPEGSQIAIDMTSLKMQEVV